MTCEGECAGLGGLPNGAAAFLAPKLFITWSLWKTGCKEKKTKKIAHFLLLSKFHMNFVQMGNKIKTEITAYKKCMNPQLLPTVFKRTPGTSHYQKEDHLLAD